MPSFAQVRSAIKHFLVPFFLNSAPPFFTFITPFYHEASTCRIAAMILLLVLLMNGEFDLCYGDPQSPHSGYYPQHQPVALTVGLGSLVQLQHAVLQSPSSRTGKLQTFPARIFLFFRPFLGPAGAIFAVYGILFGGSSRTQLLFQQPVGLFDLCPDRLLALGLPIQRPCAFDL